MPALHYGLPDVGWLLVKRDAITSQDEGPYAGTAHMCSHVNQWCVIVCMAHWLLTTTRTGDRPARPSAWAADELQSEAGRRVPLGHQMASLTGKPSRTLDLLARPA